jgi:hypothetical protein
MLNSDPKPDCRWKASSRIWVYSPEKKEKDGGERPRGEGFLS